MDLLNIKEGGIVKENDLFYICVYIHVYRLYICMCIYMYIFIYTYMCDKKLKTQCHFLIFISLILHGQALATKSSS